MVRYALEGLKNKVLAAEYRLKLPNEKALLAELRQIRRAWEQRHALRMEKARKR